MAKSSDCCKSISVSVHSEGHTAVLASDLEESMSPSTTIVGSIPNLKPSLQASLDDLVDIQDSGGNPHKDLLDKQSFIVASDSYQPTIAESQGDSAVAEVPVSVEAPIPATAITQVPGISQYLHHLSS